MLHQLLIKCYQTVIAQKLALWFKTWQNKAISKEYFSSFLAPHKFWVPRNCVFLRFKGKRVENNYTDGRQFEREKSLLRLRWATICISSAQIVFVTMQFLWGAWFSAWNLWCIVLEVATTNTRCLHLAELKLLKRKVALPGKVEAACPVPWYCLHCLDESRRAGWRGGGESIFWWVCKKSLLTQVTSGREPGFWKSWRLGPLETPVRWGGSLVSRAAVTQRAFLVHFDRGLPFSKARDQYWVGWEPSSCEEVTPWGPFLWVQLA